MPNWCSSAYALYGTREIIEKAKGFVEKALQDAPYQDAHDPHHWLGQLVVAAGGDFEKISCRGWIQDITEIQTGEDGSSYFLIYSEDAWGPKEEVFEYLIRNICPELKYCYLAEEPGCELYVNTDETGMYFREKWLLSIPDDGVHEYFETKEAVVSYFNEMLHIQADSVEEIHYLLAEKDLVEICLFEFTH